MAVQQVSTLLLNHWFPPVLGGVQTYVGELAEVLAAPDFLALAPRTEGDEAFDRAQPWRTLRYEPERADAPYVGLWRELRRHLRGARGLLHPSHLATLLALGPNRHLVRRVAVQIAALAPLLASQRPQLAIAGTPFPSGVTALLLREHLGVPYVVVTHAAEIADPSGRSARLMRRVLQGAARVVAVSRFTEGLVRGHGVAAERIVRVPPGIDATPFLVRDDAAVAELARRLGVAGRRVVLTHGRLTARKGHDMVMRGLPRLLAEVPDVVYLITGTGEHEPALRALARELGVEPHVVFAGAVEPRDLPALYALCDVFVMASRRIGASVEGFGIVCLEAAAAGKPVVAGRSGGTPDAVDDGTTGMLVDPESPEAIAGAISRLLTDRALAERMGEAGRRRVLASFDRQAFARRVRSLVDEALKPPR